MSISTNAKTSAPAKISSLLKNRQAAEAETAEEATKPDESSGELQSIHVSKAANGYTARSERKAEKDAPHESKEHVFTEPEKLLEHIRSELGCKAE